VTSAADTCGQRVDVEQKRSTPRRRRKRVELGSGAGDDGVTHGPGGGWRALLADVRGEGHPLLAALDLDVSDPSAALGDRWCPTALDEAWRRSPAFEQATPARETDADDVLQVS
jgi:hypothetical protein